MDMPLVTAIICSYNYARYLRQAIASIIDQSYTNWELIIVDDASSDESPEIVREFAARFPDKIRAFFHTRNTGPAVAAQFAVSNARGEFLTFVDSDDVATPQRMERAVAFLRARPDVAAVFSKAAFIDSNGNAISGGGMEELFNRPAGDLRTDLLNGNFLCTPTCVARADAMRTSGTWNAALRYVPDFEMWMRMLARYELARVDDIWVHYRIHDRNLTLHGLPRRRVTIENVAVILRALRHWPLERLFRFESPPGTPEHDKERAVALAKVAERCLSMDKQYLGRAMLGSTQAYLMAMDALLIDPHCAQARKVLDDALEYMESFLPNPS